MVTTNKTQPTNNSIQDFLSNIENESQRSDALTLIKLMEKTTGELAVVWGSSIVGFGNYHYVYESGREGDTPVVSFAVRKNALTLYGVLFYEQNNNNLSLASKLGPHSHGKGCLYIKSLADVDISILEKMIYNAAQARSN